MKECANHSQLPSSFFKDRASPLAQTSTNLIMQPSLAGPYSGPSFRLSLLKVCSTIPGSKVLECCSPFSSFSVQSCLRVPSMNKSAPEESLIGEGPVSRGHTQCCLSEVESSQHLEEEEVEEESGRKRKQKQEDSDGAHASPLRRCGAFRTHNHTNDFFKRHSWGPGKDLQDPMSR